MKKSGLGQVLRSNPPPCLFVMNEPVDLLLSGQGARKLGFGAVQLQRPSSRHLGERLGFLDLLLLFDLVQEKFYKRFVTCKASGQDDKRSETARAQGRGDARVSLHVGFIDKITDCFTYSFPLRCRRACERVSHPRRIPASHPVFPGTQSGFTTKAGQDKALTEFKSMTGEYNPGSGLSSLSGLSSCFSQGHVTQSVSM